MNDGQKLTLGSITGSMVGGMIIETHTSIRKDRELTSQRFMSVPKKITIHGTDGNHENLMMLVGTQSNEKDGKLSKSQRKTLIACLLSLLTI